MVKSLAIRIIIAIYVLGRIHKTTIETQDNTTILADLLSQICSKKLYLQPYLAVYKTIVHR